MLHSQGSLTALSDEELRKAILAAINNEAGATFIYDETLIAKLQGHGVSIQDLLSVCQKWEWVRDRKWDKTAWRYKIEGENSNGQWMALVVAVSTDPLVCVAVTGFRCGRGRRTKP